MLEEIERLKKEKNAVILAHNYQIPEIQDMADFVGDSLQLSKMAASTDADVIVFCGVHFMAESAKILSPGKKVLLPVYDAGCPMADMIDADELRDFKSKHPDGTVVCYVNSSAEVKAESDVCCTSSNALELVKGIDNDKILFVPDKNLGSYIGDRLPEKEVICWEGFCITHHRVQHNEIDKIREAKKGVKILVHPECNPEVVAKADFVGSTSEIIKFVKDSEDKELIIGTEMGILHKLRSENPDKTLYLLSPHLVCYNMKKTSLKDVLDALKEEKNEINVDENILIKARKALDNMIRA